MPSSSQASTQGLQRRESLLSVNGERLSSGFREGWRWLCVQNIAHLWLVPMQVLIAVDVVHLVEPIVSRGIAAGISLSNVSYLRLMKHFGHGPDGLAFILWYGICQQLSTPQHISACQV